MFPPLLPRAYGLWRDYLAIEHHWQARYPQQWLALRYEDLISQPLQELSRLCEFLGQPLDAMEQQRIAATMVKKPTQRSAAEVWQIRAYRMVGLLDEQPLQAEGYTSKGYTPVDHQQKGQGPS